MLHTVLLDEILKKSHEIREEFGGEHLSATHIAIAVSEFCKTKYIGFAISDITYRPSRFEEERLRYIAAKEVKVSSFFKITLKNNVKKGIKEREFDFSLAEKISALRGAEVLSADVVFLCALKEFQGNHKAAVRTMLTEEAVFLELCEVDSKICDYVIEKVEEVRATLYEKVKEAIAIRDWKAAPKFDEPENLLDSFFKKIKKTVADNILTLKFSRFFGKTDLKVSIHRVGDIYYIHDNGCAANHLLKQVGDKAKCERIIKKVCNKCWIDGNRITGSFITPFQFLYYLQNLIFIAHADIFYTRAEKQFYSVDKDYVFIPASKAEPLNEEVLIEQLKKAINFYYDEKIGLYYWMDIKYSLFSTRAAYLIETLEKGAIRISDKRKGNIEGEIFEAFYWNNDDIGPYSKFINKTVSRFGGEFDGRNVYLTEKQENFAGAIYRFLNIAVLLSEFGHDIRLPKTRRK